MVLGTTCDALAVCTAGAGVAVDSIADAGCVALAAGTFVSVATAAVTAGCAVAVDSGLAAGCTIVAG